MSMRSWLRLPLESTGTRVVSGENISASHEEVWQSGFPSASASFLHAPPRRRHMSAPHWLPRGARLLPSMSWTGDEGQFADVRSVQIIVPHVSADVPVNMHGTAGVESLSAFSSVHASYTLMCAVLLS